MGKRVQNITRRGELSFIADSQFDNEILLCFEFEEGSFVFDDSYKFILTPFDDKGISASLKDKCGNLIESDDSEEVFVPDDIDLSECVFIDSEHKEIRIIISVNDNIKPGFYLSKFYSVSTNIESKIFLEGKCKFL